MKILITGFPGTGKSTIATELKKLGRNAYDPQMMRGYMHVEDKVTGKHITQPDPVPTDWFDEVGSYNWDPIRIEKLLDTNDDIFVCSLAHNQSEFYSHFDKIFLLTVDDDTLRERLQQRPSNSIGHKEEELRAILEKRHHFEQSLQEMSAEVIDTNQTITQVVDSILSNV